MKLVVDTNIVIAALLKDGLTRKIIFERKYILYTPAYTLSEIEKYKGHICAKAHITLEEYEEIIQGLFHYIHIISAKIYSLQLVAMEKQISDIKDMPFLALADAINATIWSDDKHFKEQKIIKVYTTKELLALP